MAAAWLLLLAPERLRFGTKPDELPPPARARFFFFFFFFWAPCEKAWCPRARLGSPRARGCVDAQSFAKVEKEDDCVRLFTSFNLQIYPLLLVAALQSGVTQRRWPRREGMLLADLFGAWLIRRIIDEALLPRPPSPPSSVC
jgi:hypothetical protein